VPALLSCVNKKVGKEMTGQVNHLGETIVKMRLAAELTKNMPPGIFLAQTVLAPKDASFSQQFRQVLCLAGLQAEGERSSPLD
jgi:hypothetical protein